MGSDDEDVRVDAFVREQKALWARAERLAAKHPNLDVDGLFRTLKNLKRSPEERLRLGLRAGRLAKRG